MKRKIVAFAAYLRFKMKKKELKKLNQTLSRLFVNKSVYCNLKKS